MLIIALMANRLCVSVPVITTEAGFFFCLFPVGNDILVPE